MTSFLLERQVLVRAESGWLAAGPPEVPVIMRTMLPKSRPIGSAGSPSRSVPVIVNGRLRLRHGHDEANGGEDVADADALGLGGDLDHRLAGVVDLPRQLPAALLRAADGLHELLDHFLEGVAVAVMEDGHPGRGDCDVGALEVLDVGSLDRTAKPCRHLHVMELFQCGHRMCSGRTSESNWRRPIDRRWPPHRRQSRRLLRGVANVPCRRRLEEPSAATDPGHQASVAGQCVERRGRPSNVAVSYRSREREASGEMARKTWRRKLAPYPGELIVAGLAGDQYSGRGRGVAPRWGIGRRSGERRRTLPGTRCQSRGAAGWPRAG